MKIQAELPKSRSESLQARSRIEFMLEADHEVVRIANCDAISSGMHFSPLIDPPIENLVHEHVRKQRR